MSLQIGIVGLPNVGKSTIFNALTKTAAANAANYPFCTIDPNVGIVSVPDQRLNKLAELINPKKIIPTVVEFVDIAGLVQGASRGEGLGNQFLGHIRECNAIAQVVRMFEDSDIVHVAGKIDPKSDLETILAELIIADLQTVEKRVDKISKMAKSGDKIYKTILGVIFKLKEGLEQGKLALEIEMAEEEKELIKDLFLLTHKPILYIANVKETELATFDLMAQKKGLGLSKNDELIPISAKVESELIDFSEEERKEYLKELGVMESGLDQLIRGAYHKLGLITFFTAGPQEVRAWTVRRGAKAPEAAGVIHTDFQKGFICAETIKYSDYIACGSEVQAKEKGLMRTEGKEYLVQDGDIFHFRFNV